MTEFFKSGIKMEAKERSIHLVSLGSQMGVEVLLNKNMPFLSNRPFDAYAQDDRIVVNGYNGTNSHYYVGLHELGHIYYEHPVKDSPGGKQYDENVLEGESLAWLWAFDKALEEMSEYTKELITSDFALGSYAKNYPGPRGKSYWKVMEKIARRIEYAFD